MTTERAVRARATPTRIAMALAVIAAVVIGTVAAVILLARQSSSDASGGSLALAACDAAGLVPCDQQSAVVTIPIPDSGLSLTYSSQWAPGRTDRPDWNAGSLGLGGFAINVLQRYDARVGVLIGGDGSWRFASETSAAPGQKAVPSFDGSLAYVFDSAGRHVRTVDGHLGETLLTIGYDSAGRVAEVDGTVSGSPAHLTVQRDSHGTPQAVIGIDGATTQLVVDSTGHLVQVSEPGGAIHLTWTAGGLVTSETDAMGAVTRFAYDNAGRLIREIDPDGVTQTLHWSSTANGIEVRVSPAASGTATYRAERIGNDIVRTYIDPSGATTTETYGSDGSRSLRTPGGTTDLIGAVASPVWGMAAPLLTPEVETRPGGVVSRTEVTQSLQKDAGLPYSLNGSVTSTVNGARWVQTFDPGGRSVTLVDPAGRSSVDTYDQSGRLLSSTAPQTAATQYSYDGHGRVVGVTIGSGASAQTTHYSYDPSTGAITTTLPDGHNVVTTVDTNGNPSSVTEPDGSTTVDTYDADGRLIQVQPPDSRAFTLGSSPAGKSTAFMPPAVGTDTSVQTSSYDSDGNITAISGPRSIQYSYDSAGRVVDIAFDQGRSTAAYNTADLLSRDTDPSGIVTAYGYSGSLLDRLSWSGPLTGSVSVTLDANGRTVAASVDGSTAMKMAYDGAGDLTDLAGLAFNRDPTTGLVTSSALGAVRTQDQYDNNDQVVREITTISGTLVLDLRYTRDSMGRISTVAQTDAGGITTTTAYAYDADGRLAQVTINGRVVEVDSYDANGNRVTVTGAHGTTHATYDARDRLVNWGSSTYSWAPDGNLVGINGVTGSSTFTFDDLGRLRKVVLPDGHTVSYLIDAQGQRVGREVDGTLVTGYLYDPVGNIVAETNGSGAVVARFGYDDLGHVSLMERGGTSYRVITDTLGSPLLVIDASTGAVVDSIRYDAWGRITNETAPGTTPFGFAGGLLDPDTGLVHFGARDYDPATGRWTASDPLLFNGGDANLYRYSGGDPVNAHDPSGLLFCVSGDPTCYPTEWEALANHRINEAHNIQQQIENDQSWRDTTFERAPGGGLYYNGPSGSGYIPPPESPPTSPPAPPAPPAAPRSVFRCGGLLCFAPPGVPSHCTALVCGNQSGGPPTNDPGCTTSIGASCDPNPGGGFNCGGLICKGEGGGACILAWCSYGDTHLLTASGTHVDFQAAGEFIVLKSPDGKLEVQARQGLTTPGTEVTFNTAIAANLDGDRIGVYAREPSFLKVNGAPISANDVEETLPHGGTLVRHGGFVVMTWTDGSTLTITPDADWLDYSFRPGSDAAKLTGLLGNGDGKPGDLVGRDGSVLTPSDPAYSTKVYSQFGDSWRVSQSESLFDYRPGESTATFTNLAVPYHAVSADTLSASVRASAERVCRALGVLTAPLLDDCILDVGETGNPQYAEGEALIAAAGVREGGQPPPSTAPGGSIAIGQAVSGSITAPNSQVDYTFTGLANDIVYLESKAPCDNSLDWNLLRPDGSLKNSNSECGDIGREVLSASGTWTVQVKSNGSTGPYAFAILAVPQMVTTPITVGQAISGAVARIGAWYDYTFTATAGEVVDLKQQSACNNNLQWGLYRPDGSQQAGSSGCGTIGRELLGESGTWTVQIYEFQNSTATGPYGFVLQPGQ